MKIIRSKHFANGSVHAPSALSVNKKYRGDLLNAAFFTELSGFIEHYQPSYWLHGHMHDSVNYKIGETEIICNPLGYHAVDINRGFDPHLCRTL